MSDPLEMSMVVGGVLMLAGVGLALGEAFKESAWWGLAVLALPLVGFGAFVSKRWDDCAAARRVWLVGFFMFTGSLGVHLGGSVRSRGDRHPLAEGLDESGRAAPPAFEVVAPPAPSAPAATPAPAAPEVSGDLTEQLEVARGRAVARKVAAIEAWRRAQHDRRPGARREMLEALGGRRCPAEADAALAASVRERRPAAQEALECVPLAPPETRQALVAGLGRADPGMLDQEIARALIDLEDDERCTVEESLVRLGFPREKAARRLILARGPAWPTSSEGVAVLGLLPARCLLHLLAAPEPALRGHGARLLAASDPARAVARLVPLLDGQEPDPAVRAEVAEALATLADPAVVPALCRALVGEQDVEAQAALRHALLAARGAERAVMELLASSGPDERRAGAAGLGVLSTGLAASTHVGTLLGVVRDPDRGVALEATRALAVAGRSREGRAELVRRAETIATLAREARDDELRRSLRALHHAITGRLP